MKGFHRFCIVLFLFLFSKLIWAGPRVGNGGGGWRCFKNQETVWIKSLDLFEAIYEHNLKLEEHFDDQTRALLTKYLERIEGLDHDFARNLRGELELFEKNKHYVSKVYLENTNDSFARIYPGQELCAGGQIEYVQIINYTQEGRVLIQQDFWQQLSSLDKVALYLHELIYAHLREKFDEKDSIRTRKLVGLILSDIPDQELGSIIDSVFNELEGSSVLEIDPDILFYLLKDQKTRDFSQAVMQDYCLKYFNRSCPVDFQLMAINVYSAAKNYAHDVLNYRFLYKEVSMGLECSIDFFLEAALDDNNLKIITQFGQCTKI